MVRNRNSRSRPLTPLLLALGLLGVVAWTATSFAEPDAAPPMLFLNDPSTFDGLETDTARSLAYFLEAGKVITHPRCLNCHPSGDSPLQGDAMEPHEPMVVHGRDGHGAVGQRCQTCHFEHNFDAGGVPGAKHWHLAPPEMAWVGLSLGEICRQLKDPQRNGGRDLEEISTHMAEDPLVGWGWEPGAGRQPVPGDWETFGALIRAWVDTGAVCPPE
ncbi:MAG: Isoquinoline 1-oxidoreductase subunit [Acidobacteriota bacterium]